MPEVEVRDRLPRDAAWVLGLSMAALAIADARRFGLGWDARAYYTAWDGQMYGRPPGTANAFLYSPAFAEAVWPLTHLPWAGFAALFIGAGAACVIWMLKPLGWQLSAPFFLACFPEILSGNVYWLLALSVVLGIERPYVWAAPALTKVLPCLGPVWFLARREWAKSIAALMSTMAVALISWLFAPELWINWFTFLYRSSEISSSVGTQIIPPLIIRMPLAVALTVWAARRDRAALLPLAMLLASPVIGLGSFAVLAAVPRLRKASRMAPGQHMRPSNSHANRSNPQTSGKA